MGYCKSRSASKKFLAASNRSSCNRAVTRAAVNEQPMTPSRGTSTNPTKRATRQTYRIVKLIVDNINDNDTNQDPGGVETPTVEEAEDDCVTQ